MPTSSIWNPPPIADIFTQIGTVSQATFNQFLPAGEFSLGVFLGTITVLLVIGAFIGGVAYLWKELKASKGHLTHTELERRNSEAYFHEK